MEMNEYIIIKVITIYDCLA